MTDQASDQAAPPAPVDTDDTELDEQLATDALNLASLNSDIDELTKQRDALKARFRERLPAGRSYTFGGRTLVKIADPVMSFDAKLAAQVIPAALLASVSLSRPDADLCERVLPPELFAQCKKPKAAAVSTP